MVQSFVKRPRWKGQLSHRLATSIFWGYHKSTFLSAIKENKEAVVMVQEPIRRKIIEELQAGHLGLAMKLVEDHDLEIDDKVRDEAVKACVSSLKRHFHWIVPAFVQTFGIKEDVRLHNVAIRIIALSLRHGQPLIADLASRTFGIAFDENVKAIIEAAKSKMVNSLGQAEAVVIQGGNNEYKFKIE